MTTTAAYRYRAVREDGTLVMGVVQAENREAVAANLTRQGFLPVAVGPEPPSSGVVSHLRPADAAQGLRMLADLVEAGLPMGRALAAFAEVAPAAWRPGLPSVIQAVREGQGLAAALASGRVGLSAVVLGLIRAGEAGAGLGRAIRRAAEIMEHDAATRSALHAALAYPLLLAGAGTASLGLLVEVVIPRFAAILADLGQGLPASTQFVLAAASLAHWTFPPGILLGLIGWWVLRQRLTEDAARIEWHRFLQRLPVIGSVRRGAASARVAASLAALLEEGVPVARALPEAARASGDAAMTVALLQAREAVTAGKSLAAALESTAALTPTLHRLIRAGEASGRVPAMLIHGARIEGDAARGAVARAVRFVEPALIVGFGGIVALVAAALLQAVYAVRPGG